MTRVPINSSWVWPFGLTLLVTILLLFTGSAGSAPLPAGPTLCKDDFGCDFKLCDSSNPCNRGCKCKYIDDARVGHCVPWFKNFTGRDRLVTLIELLDQNPSYVPGRQIIRRVAPAGSLPQPLRLQVLR